MKLSMCHDQWVINHISLPSPVDGKESSVHEKSTSVCRHDCRVFIPIPVATKNEGFSYLINYSPRL